MTIDFPIPFFECGWNAVAVGTQIGPQKVDSSLEWKVKESTIAFKDEKEAVSQYQIKLTGNELRLSSPKSLTIYFKEK